MIFFTHPVAPRALDCVYPTPHQPCKPSNEAALCAFPNKEYDDDSNADSDDDTCPYLAPAPNTIPIPMPAYPAPPTSRSGSIAVNSDNDDDGAGDDFTLMEGHGNDLGKDTDQGGHGGTTLEGGRHQGGGRD
ncbi:hypothetical protein EDD85DRAFT_794003 [Armillaria nabsnona]|nr:hypothetical protein EDD85DRAFT_794003 [Armillaria nabsnona]